MTTTARAEARLQGQREGLKRLHALRRGMVRRLVLEDGRIDVFAEHVLGYTLKPFHRKLLAFQDTILDSTGGLALAPRGFGKSTILTIARAIFEIVLNPDIRILIASNTAAQAEVFLREVRSHFEKNEELRATFGNFANPRGKWDVREIIVLPRKANWKEATVTTLGYGGPIAGRHYDLILVDDLVDEENSFTEGQRAKTRTWFYKVLLPTVADDSSRVMACGTRYHPLDLYGHLLKHEMKDRNVLVRAIEADGSTPWPEKFSLDWLKRKREAAGTAIFNAQYQNDTEQMKGAMFREEWFRYYDRHAFEEASRDGRIETWIGCDPAATKADQVGAGGTSDFWTMCVASRIVGPDGPSREIYLREVWRGRVTKQDYLNKLRSLNEKYQPQLVAIEAVAAQEYLVQDAERYMPVTRIDRTTDKVSRAFWLQPFFENRQILLPEGDAMHGDPDAWAALEEELLLFPNAEHDDLFDAVQTVVDVAMGAGQMGMQTLELEWH